MRNIVIGLHRGDSTSLLLGIILANRCSPGYWLLNALLAARRRTDHSVSSWMLDTVPKRVPSCSTPFWPPEPAGPRALTAGHPPGLSSLFWLSLLSLLEILAFQSLHGRLMSSWSLSALLVARHHPGWSKASWLFDDQWPLEVILVTQRLLSSFLVTTFSAE